MINLRNLSAKAEQAHYAQTRREMSGPRTCP
jgi:hypothetical protein